MSVPLWYQYAVGGEVGIWIDRSFGGADAFAPDLYVRVRPERWHAEQM